MTGAARRPEEDRRPAWHRPEAWLAAESRIGRYLTEAAVAVARLDERMYRMPEDRRAAVTERVALVEAGDLLWAEGIRLSPDRLALVGRGRAGRARDVEQAVARGAWAARRMSARSPVQASVEAIRAFLGLRNVAEPPAPEAGIDRDLLWLHGVDDHGLGEWCALQARLAEAHPLTRAAAGFHLWRGLALSPPDRLLEPAVLASRLAAAAGRGGLAAVPLAFGNPRSVPPARGDADDRLAGWLEALGGAAMRVHLAVDRLEDWQGRAAERTRDMHGKGVQALLRLLAGRPAVSARDAAEALGVTASQARLLLDRLEGRDLVRELTGQRRFRFWTVRA